MRSTGCRSRSDSVPAPCSRSPSSWRCGRPGSANPRTDQATIGLGPVGAAGKGGLDWFTAPCRDTSVLDRKWATRYASLVALATQSTMCSARMGSDVIVTPYGESASSIAALMIAGVSIRPPSPAPLIP